MQEDHHHSKPDGLFAQSIKVFHHYNKLFSEVNYALYCITKEKQSMSRSFFARNIPEEARIEIICRLRILIVWPKLRSISIARNPLCLLH